jgi:hypothetical protein
MRLLAIFVAPTEQGEIGLDLFRAACRLGLEGLGVEAPRPSVSGWPVEALAQGEEPAASGDEPGDGWGVVRSQ